MNDKPNIRIHASDLCLQAEAVIKEWNRRLYDAGWPCSSGMSSGRRLELSQVAKRLAYIEAAARLLKHATK